MARTTDAREKALETAERLFRSQGVAATGLAQIIAESGAPKGSFYFHFPGGKDQLAAEVIERFGSKVLAGLRQLSRAQQGSAEGFVDALCRSIADEMRVSDYQLGCVLQNVAAERAPCDPALTALVDRWLAAWREAIAEHLRACEIGNAEATATALLAALEGARTLARSACSDAPFDAVSSTINRALC